MYIAEQNMLSVALGLSKLGFIPYVSTFAAFLTRAYDQIRMSQYSNGNIKIVGSHCGVSIGPDGSSQMGLEDISMMRSVNSSIVLYPSDGVSTYALAHIVSKNEGIAYIRTTREKLPLIYDSSKEFKIGGSHVLHESNNDKIVVITAGITLHETLKAYEMLKKENISICIIDAYSVKPLDEKTIISQAERVKNIIVVEDHYEYGGLGEAVFNCLKGKELRIKHLAVRKTPHSGTPQELLSYEGIDAKSIFDAVVKG